MDADKVQQWAREAGAHQTHSGGLCLYSGQFEAFARLARTDALEEAAKVCIREGEIGRIDGKNTYGECHENASRECAMAIRALAAAEKEPT